ncbi:hypothetical protein ACFL52_01145 [Candidatus Margulisiibacteriota bacterium]
MAFNAQIPKKVPQTSHKPRLMSYTEILAKKTNAGHQQEAKIPEQNEKVAREGIDFLKKKVIGAVKFIDDSIGLSFSGLTLNEILEKVGISDLAETGGAAIALFEEMTPLPDKPGTPKKLPKPLKKLAKQNASKFAGRINRIAKNPNQQNAAEILLGKQKSHPHEQINAVAHNRTPHFRGEKLQHAHGAHHVTAKNKTSTVHQPAKLFARLAPELGISQQAAEKGGRSLSVLNGGRPV